MSLHDELTATYVGDRTLSGALRFEATSATTARALPDQNLDAVCDVPAGSASPPNEIVYHRSSGTHSWAYWLRVDPFSRAPPA